ncbi:DNA -binding domain-containing protein [Guyparkeria hydrothermalis]|uniref:DNA -binding domain-containing protein n=1 Tax=Guyparkeria hydrothermalis TaxID=923 RepID=UPI003D9C7C3E
MHTSHCTWTPDWIDERRYPGRFEDCDVSCWAWAFLRRNPDYLRDVEHFDSLPSHNSDGKPNSKLSLNPVSLDERACLRFCDPPCEPEETIEEWERRTGDAIGPSLLHHLEHKWKVRGVPHPRSDNCPTPLLDSRMPYRADEGALDLTRHVHGNLVLANHEHAVPIPPGRLLISVDPSLPLDRQTEEIKKIIKSERGRRRAKGPRETSLPVMLRALDGHLQGATSREIAEVLFPQKVSTSYADSGVKDAEYHIEQAKKVRRDPYGLLLYRFSG